MRSKGGGVGSGAVRTRSVSYARGLPRAASNPLHHPPLIPSFPPPPTPPHPQLDHLLLPENLALLHKARVVYCTGFFITVSPAVRAEAAGGMGREGGREGGSEVGARRSPTGICGDERLAHCGVRYRHSRVQPAAAAPPQPETPGPQARRVARIGTEKCSEVGGVGGAAWTCHCVQVPAC